MKNKLQLSNCSNKYGAEMGRPNILPSNTNSPLKLRMEKLKWVDYDYDQGGAYWGGGTRSSIYCAWHDNKSNPVQIFVREASRQDAKEKVKSILPVVRFYN